MSAPLTAEQTFQRAQTLLQSGRSVALPELLTLIETLATSDATVPEIAELIEKDAALLGKVLSLANTVAHNPGISPIRTLSQALHRIGYQRVRTMAVSLLLLENASGAATAPEQREAAGRALAAGLLAQGTAETLGTHDPELAFACAALRQFGRILMATLAPELFRDALELARQQPPEESALRRRFGLTSLELSRRILSAARVSPEVLATLRECEPEALLSTATQHDTRLLALADFSGRLAALSLGPGAASDSFLKNTRLLARRFDRVLPEVIDCIKPAFRSADHRLRGYLRCKGVTALPSLSLSRIRQRLETVDPSVINEGDGTIGAIFAPPKAASDPVPGNVTITAAPLPPAALAIAEPAAPEPATPVAAELAPFATVAARPIAAPIPATTLANPTLVSPSHSAPPAVPSLAPFPAPLAPLPPVALAAGPRHPEMAASSVPIPALVPPAAPDDPQRAALTLIRDGFNAEECWLFHLPPGATSFSTFVGLGSRWSAIQPRAAVRAGERSVFGVCLARLETVVIHDSTEVATLPYLPAWLRESDASRGAFVLVPLSVRSTLVGLAYIGWHAPRKIALSHAQLMLAQQILSPFAAHPATRAA